MYTIKDTSWTDERIVQLKKLWADGISAAKIAIEFGVSRSAVLGKIHRLGSAARQKGARGHQRKFHKSNYAKQSSPRGASRLPARPREDEGPEVRRQRLASGALEGLPSDIPPTEFDMSIPDQQRKTLAALRWATPSRPGDCRWPIGLPGTPEFFFCGADQEENKPYCAEHCRRAFQGTPIRNPRVHQINYNPGGRRT